MTSSVNKSNQRSVERGAVLVQRLTGYHGDGKDVTNPRDLYTILSQAETKRYKAGLNIPLLVTESTLQQKVNHEMNIRVKGYRPEKRPESPPFHHQSSLELFDFESSELPTLTLVRHSSSLEDLSTLKRRDKIRTTYTSTNTSENLPSLKDKYPKVAFEDVIQFENKGDNSGIVLPKVPKVLEKTLPLAQAVVTPIPQELDSEESAVDHRLVGVPPELVGRARQILMEETYREQLRARGLGLSRTRNLFPKESGRSNDLKAYDMYPAQYWELRAETVQQPQDLELDMIDRDYYRMKQKSVLKLKVMDRESRARGERSPSDTSSPPTQRETHRTLPRLFHPKPRHNHMDSGFEDEAVGLSPFTNLMLGPVVAEAAGTCHQDTDSLAGPPNSRKTNRHMFPYLMSQDPLPASVTRFPKYTQVVSTPRPKYMPPTSVVNLTIDQPTPRRRRPRHIEENLERQKHRESRVSESAPCGKGNVLMGKSEAAPGSDATRSVTVDDVIQEASEPVSQEDEEPADDAKNKISLLTGFKTLEVFGEARNEPTERTQKIITKASVPSRYRPQCYPPLYKLDMKNYPPQGNMIQALLALEEHQATTGTDNNPISLRVIDGDAILSKVQTNVDPQTSRTVKSEGSVGPASMRDTPVLSRS